MSVIQEFSYSRLNSLLGKEEVDHVQCKIKHKKVTFLSCVSDDENDEAVAKKGPTQVSSRIK